MGIKHAHESTLEEMENLIGPDFIIKKVFYALDQASWSEKELNTYEKMIKTEMDNLAVEEQKIMDAEAKGEARQKISIAKKMLVKNKPLDKIIDFTGLK
nr:hypothetical protein [Rickettsia montanensis]